MSLIFHGLNLGIDFEGGVAWEVPSRDLTVDDADGRADRRTASTADAKVQTLTSRRASERRAASRSASSDRGPAAGRSTALAERGRGRLTEVSVSSVSSSWGRAITEKAIRALVVFLVLVMLFIAWRLEWRMALSAIIAMLHDVLISVGVYSVFGFEVTPATVIAFLTILGFSLYDTIVVFDKVHENTRRASRRRRLPYADVINVSMNQVLMRSLNTSSPPCCRCCRCSSSAPGILGAVTLREFSLALLVGLIAGFVLVDLHRRAAAGDAQEPRRRGTTVRHDRHRDRRRARATRSRRPPSPPPRRRRSAHRCRAPPTARSLPRARQPAGPCSRHPPRPRKKKRR